MIVHDSITVSNALIDLARVARALHVPWALIGGQALRAHGVPRSTVNVDVRVPSNRLDELAESLVRDLGWMLLIHEDADHDARKSVSLRAPGGLLVDLHAAQQPVQAEMIESSEQIEHVGVVVPVAPLGDVLLMKLKAGRRIDIAAIEQTAEHLRAAAVKAAVAWAETRDATAAAQLGAIMDAARVRRAPKSTVRYERKPRA